MAKISRAVLPAAGLGTRFLPASKVQPKEMLPLVDKPIIQYVVEEAVASGIENLVIVTGRGINSIEDHFDISFELETILEERGKSQLLNLVRSVSDTVPIAYIRQKEALGLGHAVLTAKDAVGEEPFAVILPDDIIDSAVPILKSMVEAYDKYGAGVVAVERVDEEGTEKYGIIESEPVSERVYRILGLVEKPGPAGAPSHLGIIGRYILTPEIFEAIKITPPGTGNEIQLTDALQILLTQQHLYAYELDGIRYDTGTHLGWLEANIACALKRDDIAPELREYIKKLLG